MTERRRGRRAGADGTSGDAPASAAPGKRTRSEGRYPPRPATTPRAPEAAARQADQGFLDAAGLDPFGLHLADEPGNVPHRTELEPMFGQSFADVQATTGDHALAARGIRGAAEGSAVRFADERPSRDVVAHELTHVAQQRQAGTTGAALLDESQPSDAAEVEARAIGDQVRAGDLSPVTVRARPSAAVHFNRDTDDADELAEDLKRKEEHDGWNVTALSYLDRNLRHILLLARQQLAAEAWPLNHPRLQWATDPDAIAAALNARLLELTADRMESFPPFFHPIDLWTVIDSNRPITSGTPGEYAKGRPTAKGPMRRDGVADQAVALELAAALRRSLARMAPRFVATADDIHPLPVEAGQLVTSAPIDRLWARVLADPNMVLYTAPTGAAGASGDKAKRPTGPGVLSSLRPVEYEWMGSQDLRMWNVLRVTSPADATTEEVAAQLYQYPGVFSVQSHNAFAIVNAAPFFVLPRTWAKDFPDAVKWASAEHSSAREEPIDAVLQSSAVDQAAIAQGADEVAHPLAHKHKAGRADTERLTALLWRGADQLAFTAEALAPWKLDPQLVAERDWTQRRAMELIHESPEQIAKWAPVIEAQQRTITTATAAALEVVDAARSAGVAPNQPKAGPFRRTLAAYAAALATSHLADVARARMATADAERQALAMSFVEDAIADATSATESLREAEGGSYDPSTDAGDLIRQRKNIQRGKLQQRAAALDGQAMDPDVLEDLTINAGMVAVHARAKELAIKAAALSSMLLRTENSGVIASIAAAFDSSFDTLPGKLDQLAYACQALEQNMSDAGFLEELGHRPTSDKDEQAAHARYIRGLRRKALIQAQADLAAIPAAYQLDRLQREALDAVQTNQIATLAINVIILIAASVATSGAAAWAGGAARGFAMGRLAMAEDTAATLGAAVDVVVDSGLTAAVQAGMNGDSFLKGTAENILANVGVRAAMARFAPLVRDLDDEAATLWTSGSIAAKGSVVLAKGAVVGAELITAAGVSYVAQRLVRGAPPPSDDLVTTWFIQGASMAIGRLIATRTTQLHARLDRLGARAGSGVASGHAKLLARVQTQAKLAAHVTDAGDADQAMRLLVENRAILDEEAHLLRDLEANPAKAEALGLSLQDRATFARDNAAARADTAKQGMDVLPLRLAGIDEVIPGALWKGSSEQIATAIHQARAVGLAVHVDEVGNRNKRWRIRIGESDRALEIDETTPRPIAGENVQRPRAAGVVPEARAILHNKAIAELAKIIPTEARTKHASRGLLITHEEGRRMAELLPDVEGAETIEYKSGLLVRIHDPDGGPMREWYYEFRDDAHTTAQLGKKPARAAGAHDDPNGLPAPNVATIEIYAYSGVKEIKGRGKLADWSKEARDNFIRETNEEDALLLAGHVAVSFDGGKTLYGFTPKADPSLSVDTVINMLRKGEVFPGQVRVDNDHYKRAAEKAAEGWDTITKRVVVTFDPAEQPALAARAVAEMEASAKGEHSHGYKFPAKDLQPPRDAIATNGQPFAGQCIGNCATWLRFVDVPIPEQSGRMTEYMREFEKWSDADAPIPGRPTKEEPPP